MAGSFLALFDDIATLLDDISAMTKVAAKKTTGLLGDDLALNAEQVSGVSASRELPVVWAVAKGSLRNKAILIPLALLISALAPWLVNLLLMLGGLYLCVEGAEKILHSWLNLGRDDPAKATQHRQQWHDALKAGKAGKQALLKLEKSKIKGAIRTDFIISAEIIVITLGTLNGMGLAVQLAVLVSIGLLVTLFVYGLVAGIVKLDDLGLYLQNTTSRLAHHIGRLLLVITPWVMKSLSLFGTAAMFLVGGGILLHGLPWLEHWLDKLLHWSGWLATSLASGLLGLVVGVLLAAVIALVQKYLPKRNAAGRG